jgi:hypothetical protein
VPLKSLDECIEEIMEPIIENFLFKKTYVLEHGLKEAYKSWFAAYIAVCVASGKLCFGHKVVKPGIVVYVYGEGRMAWRLKAICRGMGIEMPKTLYPFRLRADLSNKIELNKLAMQIPEGTTLIVIDNYEKYWESHTEEKIVSPAVKFLQRITDHATVLLIQHQPKNASRGKMSHANAIGSSRIVNAADSTFELKLDKKSKIVTCEIYHRDEEAPAKAKRFKLEKYAEDSLCLVLVDGGQAAESCEDASGNTYKQILARLEAAMKPDEILSKTGIYEAHLKGHGIRGLSSKGYYDYYHGRLVKEGYLNETEKSKFIFCNDGLLEVSDTSQK